ncbi:MAG: glycosidase [Minisyncoccia bacterium]
MAAPKKKKVKKVLKKKRTSKKVPRKPRSKISIKKRVVSKKPHQLQRFVANPIISPAHHSHWQSKATFNPTAIFGDGQVHIIYRAIGAGDVSVFGYAVSKDGFTIEKRGTKPAYIQRNYHFERIDKENTPKINYSSGGGWNGGVEDPRLTLIDDRVYMLYTSFNGWNAIRIALTSISFKDFVNERWNWSPHVFISPPGEIHKNWVLFPEKINGKYAILHGISPHIQIEYVKDLKEFDGTKFIHSIPPSGKGHSKSWDTWLRGVGPAPIKTKYGWLVLYHAMDIKDPNRYKLGAMILDLNNPKKVVAISKQPILEPDEVYENEGFKAGVVYACGAVVVDGWLFVYYGGADTVVCVATIKFDSLIKDIVSNKPIKLRTKK